MTKLEKIQKELEAAIQKAVDKFNNAIPGIQENIYSDMEGIVKDLDLKGNSIASSVKNIKTIGALKNKINKVVLSNDYKNALKEYIQSFSLITKLNKEYFTELVGENGSDAVLKAIRESSIQSAVQSLTESGITANVTEQIQNILKTNITSGGNYNDLLKQLRDGILTNDKGTGYLERYTKQITTDSLNQYNRQYAQTVTSDLGFKWFMFSGSLLETSRDWCEAMKAKKYIHISEFKEIAKGIIDGVKVPINAKTKLWFGAVLGTNEFNLQTYCGGYSCGHQLSPVSEALVPDNLVEKFKNK